MPPIRRMVASSSLPFNTPANPLPAIRPAGQVAKSAARQLEQLVQPEVWVMFDTLILAASGGDYNFTTWPASAADSVSRVRTRGIAASIGLSCRARSRSAPTSAVGGWGVPGSTP